MSEVQQRARCELLLQTLDERSGEATFMGTERGDAPFGAVPIVDRDEGRLASHREPHVASAQFPIDLVTAPLDRAPLLVGVRLRHTRRLVDPPDGHLVAELHLALVGGACDRRRAGVARRGGERDVAFAGE